MNPRARVSAMTYLRSGTAAEKSSPDCCSSRPFDTGDLHEFLRYRRGAAFQRDRADAELCNRDRRCSTAVLTPAAPLMSQKN